MSAARQAEPERRTKVVHLTSVHGAHDVRIFDKECRSLAEAGWDVELIAPHDGNEISEGIAIRAVPKPKSRLERVTWTAARVFDAGLRARGDVFHLHDPELLPWGLALKLLGKRVIYDAHENVPKDILTKHYLPRFLRRALASAVDRLERAMGGSFDGVVAVTPGIAARFAARRAVVVRNYPRLGFFSGHESRPYATRGPIVAYLGGLSEIRGAREMVRAIGQVERGVGAELWLAGRFDPPWLEQALSSEPGWGRTVRLGWQTRAQVAETLHSARVGLLVLHPAPNHLDSLPIKLFEYMGAGLPVVASDFPAWRAVVGDAAMWVDPLDVDAVANAVQWLLTHPDEAERMGRRGADAVRRELNWERESETLKVLYRRVAGDPVARGRA